MFYKPELRKSLRDKRRHLDKASIEKASKQVAMQLIVLPEFIESKTIGFYITDENELDPAAIMHCGQALDKKFYLPTIPKEKESTLIFYPYTSKNELVLNHYHILEPKKEGQKPIATEKLDIIFVPLVGFDKYCNRIGRGAGYYDRTLAFAKNKAQSKKPLLIGLGYEFQKLSNIEPSKWDVPLDIVATEKTLYLREEG